jgi:hypothetical protein
MLRHLPSILKRIPSILITLSIPLLLNNPFPLLLILISYTLLSLLPLVLGI